MTAQGRSEALAEATERLADEVAALARILEELHVTFEWAANNDKLQNVAAEDAPDLPAMVFDLHEKLQVLALVVDELGQVPKRQRRLFS